MEINKEEKVATSFEQEVRAGLSGFPKQLSSKFFYDKTGDALFQKIMGLPEYYLTNSEMEIFETHKEAIIKAFDQDNAGFDLIELGAGDGKKTKVLLQALQDYNFRFTYKPIDISQNAIDKLSAAMADEFPEVAVVAERGTYFEVLDKLQDMSSRKKIIMFLGSNIGNLLHPQAIEFLGKLNAAIGSDDLIFMGCDQKKHPQKIRNAYNDAQGITAAFNKNILVRINKELGGDFDPETFLHWPVYDPETGTAKSYLISTIAQKVTIKALDLSVVFKAWESIHTEISQKYDDPTVTWLAAASGFQVVESFVDEKGYFKNYIFKKK